MFSFNKIRKKIRRHIWWNIVASMKSVFACIWFVCFFQFFSPWSFFFLTNSPFSTFFFLPRNFSIFHDYKILSCRTDASFPRHIPSYHHATLPYKLTTYHLTIRFFWLITTGGLIVGTHLKDVWLSRPLQRRRDPDVVHCLEKCGRRQKAFKLLYPSVCLAQTKHLITGKMPSYRLTPWTP